MASYLKKTILLHLQEEQKEISVAKKCTLQTVVQTSPQYVSTGNIQRVLNMHYTVFFIREVPHYKVILTLLSKTWLFNSYSIRILKI